MGGSKSISEAHDAPVHKQQRSVVTRQKLLDSARGVFAADGFEHARVEDIAAHAGRTRGAFYANFKDKEDVFFAIFEEDIDRNIARFSHLLQQFETLDLRMDALAQYLGELLADSQRTLLYIEFKLYAIRHPHKRKRLAELHALVCTRCSLPEINELIFESERLTADEQLGASRIIGALMDGLALNQLFDPEGLSDDQFTRYLRLCVRESLSRLPQAYGSNTAVNLKPVMV